MKREFKIFCEEVSNDGSEFKLVLKINGKVMEDRKNIWSFDDVLIEVYDFFRECLEKYNFDSRRDRYDFYIGYSWGGM